MGVQGSRARVILVLRECIWYAPVILLGSLGFPLRRVVYPPGSTLGDCLLFHFGE